ARRGRRGYHVRGRLGGARQRRRPADGGAGRCGPDGDARLHPRRVRHAGGPHRAGRRRGVRGEVRRGRGRGVLASRPLRVVASEVSVTAPAEAMGGSNVTVTFQGPNGPSDLVAFAPAGAPQGTFLTYTFAQF